MWITVATQQNSYCCDIVERHGRHINEFPVNENSFFDYVADQLSNHKVKLEDHTTVPQYIVRKVTCSYIKDHAEELQVKTISFTGKLSISVFFPCA